ncbi:hypothetical protein BGZ65_002860 [Modicella reniformis]|uniref:HECT-type E3 ubiquitin transferase E3D n=1 Tax=Modicella reniformis TaxID=1440133 RepID=A0A9P6IP53_9FUNG|nr:hypothetical protein BGZ65_002860 [Modicella reniformis]
MLPSEEIRYYAEHHSKINSITFSVRVPTAGLTCTIGPRAVDLIPSSRAVTDGQGNAQRVLLSAVVMPTRTTLDPSTTESSLLSLKLTALPSVQSSSSPSTSISASEFPPAPLPAAQLQGLINLGCEACGNILLENNGDSGNQDGGGPIQRVVDLPSEHWQELVDCWMCHEEDFTELREGDLGARIGQALVGGTYILIHAADVNQSSVVIEEDAQAIDWTKGIKRRWRPLACLRCLYPVGDGWYQSVREDGTDLELIQAKFHKYTVTFKGQDKNTGRQLSIPRQRFVSYVAAEIFESARHHATYRFILQDRLEGQDMMLMWMLNWDSTIITNQDTVQDSEVVWDAPLRLDLRTLATSQATMETEQARGKRVMKVLYLRLLSEEHYESEKQEGVYSKEMALWDRWRGDPGVESLQFQKHFFSVILEQSSRCLPPDLNGAASTVLDMDGMRVGFIELVIEK